MNVLGDGLTGIVSDKGKYSAFKLGETLMHEMEHLANPVCWEQTAQLSIFNNMIKRLREHTEKITLASDKRKMIEDVCSLFKKIGEKVKDDIIEPSAVVRQNEYRLRYGMPVRKHYCDAVGASEMAEQKRESPNFLALPLYRHQPKALSMEEKIGEVRDLYAHLFNEVEAIITKSSLPATKKSKSAMKASRDM
jgi:hypothetical protein